ncbi:hypothetical protein B9G69_002540 [Bdellovibrio sp. SKB1291214]|uniref:hypothetical protein n=1 Tax=Bdellovibrio sp. SKB1291214 TaxID=1732569 RepID=UPI000B51C5BD|nr:hypothetical protein [Bdellovibrio sp. SKB1291214]UYL09449.1 hypothetical protein B9G69_002540 [Bdellovibrio sp. SKB1291214]
MSIKAEASKLIKNHLKELNASAEILGGVFITGQDGAVAVIGVEGKKKKVIFLTSFVTDNVNKLLDAQIEVQDLLEEDGIEAISEHDYNIALEEL